MNTHLLKSIGAVFAGFLTVVFLSVATDAILEALGIFPGATNPELYVTWMLAVALAYRCVFTVTGGYVTAMLAPQNTMKHVKILGIIGTAAGIAGAIGGWDKSDHWYPIALAITGYPCVWLGGKLRVKG